MWKNLRLILWKNLVIRKRHWLLTITEILIPILLFTFMAYGRSKIDGLNKVHITEPTYHHLSNTDDIYSHLSVGELNLWYFPNNTFTKSIINKVQEKLQIPGDAVKEFTSKQELLSYFGTNSSSLIAAIIFDTNSTRNLKYDLTIYDQYFTWNTDKLFIPSILAEEIRSSKYMYKGYAALQVALDMSYMELLLNKRQIDVSFSLQEFPDPPRTVDAGLNQLFIYFLPLITIFSFIFLCPAVLKRVGEEKISGTKEYMKMVGLRSSLIWLGWFIHALITNLLSIIVIVVLMKVPFWGVSYPPIEYADGTVLFVFLFLYCMAAVTLCFLIASVLNSPSISTIIGILIWIFSYFVPQTFVTSHENLSWLHKIPFAFFPNMALFYGYSAISVYEIRETGIQWSNIFDPGSGDENDITMGSVLFMLIIDMITFMLLTLYIENVKPGEYGIAKPYSFPVTNLVNFMKRWVFHRVENSPQLLRNGNSIDLETGKKPCIQIIHLRKKFYNHVAVDDLEMDVIENQITVLLGQNGAGKTTTMSILTGMINATSGDILVNGKNIKKHTDEVRKLMGLCPQHNLLFPDLTVQEHIKFFAMLKASKDPDKETDEMLKVLGLADKKNEMTKILSGGMKRKLCLGMALIGDSKVLVLDEPTSGMDPESRRKIWDLLLEYRKSKTILITTHFMEEADVLGDKIAIMANGRLQCYGTPMQLKAKYNTGYHLCLLLESKNFIKDITNEVRIHIPEAKMIRESEDSVVYLLPLKENYNKLIATLEDKQKDWSILGINLNLTTLNDVFLKAKDEIDGTGESRVDSAQVEYVKRTPNLHRNPVNSFFALIRKRCYFLRKKYYWFIPAILVSIAIFILAIRLAMSNNNTYDGAGPSINLDLQLYGKPKVYYGGDDVSDPLITKMRKFYREIVEKQNGQPVITEDVSSAIIKEGVANIAFYQKHMIVAAEFNKTENDQIFVNSMYSVHALHSIPISINLATNVILKTLLDDTYSISISNTPLKPFYSHFAPSELSIVNVASVWLILIPISMFFFVSNFIVFPNTEISTNFIQIQTIAGIKTYFYWFTNIVFDVMFSVVPITVMFLLLCFLNWIAYNSEGFRGADIGAFIAIIVTYIFTSLPFTYLLSYRKTITGGFTLLLMIGIFGGIIPTIIIVAMEFSTDSTYMTVAKYLKPCLLILNPQFGLSYASIKFARKFVENFNWKYMDPNKRNHICFIEPNPCCYDNDLTPACYQFQNYFQNKTSGIQTDLLLMLVSFLFYFVILLILNAEIFQRVSHFIKYFPNTLRSGDKGNDFQFKEEINDQIDKDKDKTLRVRNLTKSFGKKQIVKNLKFYLKKNKCFGLLGVNGAGKSTTFRMLTKYLFFDQGEISLKLEDNGKSDIKIGQPEYCEKIGYCPQEDCLNYFLTGRELLRTMACIKGYTDSDAETIAKYLIKSFELDDYADKPCMEYSGGNKRKLSTCLAFLGSPKVILLDEPTSGVDPASRRKFWNVLSAFKKFQQTSFLLCSHSMEECENLCDEIAIMKAGEIKDQGSLLALKNKYQKGFKVTIKLKPESKHAESIKNEIVDKLQGELTEEYAGTLTYTIKDSEKRLSEVLTVLERVRDEYKNDVEDYVINQISLEDIFLSVAENE